MRNPNSLHNRRVESKRKQRINRLMQLFGLLNLKDEVEKVWGWNAKRRTVHSLSRKAVA
jgi:hypothetical protein